MAGTPRRERSLTGEGPKSLYQLGLTVIHPFWGEDRRFKLLVDMWKGYPQRIRNEIKMIIVDDHGMPSILSLLTPSVTKRFNFDLTVYEIEDDLRHNTPGALNLGIFAANTPWVLIMDSDCTFDAENMDLIMQYRPTANKVYKFDRKRITENKEWAMNERYLPCTMLMHRDIFLAVNGFDEDFTGARTGGYAYFDNHFDDKVLAAGYQCGRVQRNILAVEWMDDVCGAKVQRTVEEEKINRNIMYDKLKDTRLENNEILRFAWKRVFNNAYDT